MSSLMPETHFCLLCSLNGRAVTLAQTTALYDGGRRKVKSLKMESAGEQKK